MIKELSVEELKAKMDRKENFLLIDVREQGEWNQGYIEGAKLMPLSCFQIDFEKLKDPDQEIVIQCKSGKRSMDACQFLLGEGFSNLANVTGGIMAWENNGYKITKP